MYNIKKYLHITKLSSFTVIEIFAVFFITQKSIGQNGQL